MDILEVITIPVKTEIMREKEIIVEMENQVLAACKIGGIAFRNRILRSATDESMADSYGRPTEQLTKLYVRLAEGEIGGIITGFIAVSEEGKTPMPGMCALYSDESTLHFKQMVEEIHRYNTPIIAQIAHCGRHGIGGSRYNVNKMSETQFQQMIRDFTDTAIRCKKAGFDGIQLHCAHGYFLSEVLSPSKNNRKDAWGGSKEKRITLVEQIILSIRESMPDYPIWIKLNGEELVKGGLTVDEAAWYANVMEKAGATAIEVSRGLQEDFFDVTRGQVPIDMAFQEYHKVSSLPKPIKFMAKPIVKKILTPKQPYRLYNLETAKKIKSKVDLPVIVVGGIRTLGDCKQVLESGLDMASICRPLILEPGLVGRWKLGKLQEARCINCNYCLIGIGNRPLRCYYGKVPMKY